MSVISISDLSIALPRGADREFAVQDCSYDIAAGEILCVVGESGSGKSMTANAVMGLLPEGVSVAKGKAEFGGKDILTVSEAEQRALRGDRIAMIFQEPMTALNPLMRIGDQIAEVFEAHNRHRPAERREKALALMNTHSPIGLPSRWP